MSAWSVGVMIDRTRTPGVAHGTENIMLDLKYVANTEEVNDGDYLLTSGLDGIYPKGLPVGKVVVIWPGLLLPILCLWIVTSASSATRRSSSGRRPATV